MPKDHDIPWFGLGRKHGIEYMIMQEGPNQTWYDFTKENTEWFQAWTGRLQYAYRTFSGNQDVQKNLIKNLLEIQLPRSIQAAGVHPVNPMGGDSFTNVLLMKGGESNPDDAVVKRRRKVILKGRSEARRGGYSNLCRLAAEMDGWMESNQSSLSDKTRRDFAIKVRRIHDQLRKGFLRWRDYSGMFCYMSPIFPC
jgi:hypothetical protein